jgi:hypothetical protein
MAKKCDQCEELMINGIRCHEIGCPNAKKGKNAKKGGKR